MDPTNNLAESKVSTAENVLSQEKNKDSENTAIGLIIFFILLAILFSIPFAIYWIWAKTKWSKAAKIISTAVLSLITLGIIFLFISSSQKPSSNYTATPPANSHVNTSTSSAQTTEWKSFAGQKVTFQYPAADYAKEFEADHYFILPSSSSTNDQQIVDIDARSLTPDSKYLDMVSEMKKLIINVTEKDLDNGVKLSGQLSAKGHTFPYEIVILKGKAGFITLSTQDTTLDRFQQKVSILESILPTLKY